MSIALVCGSAHGMWEDMAAAETIIGDRPYAICGLNVSGLFLYRLDHWFVTSIDKAPVFAKAREIGLDLHGGYGEMHCPGHDFLPSVCERQRFWPVQTKGSIALFAIQVLSSLEFRSIVLAGVPLNDKSGHFYAPPWEGNAGMSDHIKVWEENLTYLRHRVRSMSGNTLRILGRPDTDWLDRG